MPEHAVSPLLLRLLGPMEVLLHGAPLPRLRTRKGEWLLALLVLRSFSDGGRPRPIDRSWLAGTLWPDGPEPLAFRSLRTALADLRRALGSEASRIYAPTPRTLALDLDGADVDLVAFDLAAAHGCTADPERREGEVVIASLEDAIALYGGPLLEGWSEPWVLSERGVREEAYLGALERLATYRLAEGDPATAEGYLRRAVAVDPFRETVHRVLMSALSASGKHAAALEVYRELRLRLHHELNAVPDPESVALFEQIRAEARAGATTAPRPAPPAMVLSLPTPPTPLLGREQEVSALCGWLGREGTRLVTLSGPLGSGKTRLGLEVATRLAESLLHGVVYVSLAPISDPALLPSAIAQTLGVRENEGCSLIESLKHALRCREILLVLDNFEQILPAAPLVAELLAGAPRLKVLVTSRAVLRLQGEQEFPVPPLPVPDPRRLPLLPALSQYPAVELFIQRAVNAKPDFALTHENAPAVAEICVHLEGLPLAIELAAVRIKLHQPHALQAKLGNRLKLLTGGARDLPARQQTLRSAIGWSYDLLDEGERRLFRRISIFVGGCTLDAAEAVCGECEERNAKCEVEAESLSLRTSNFELRTESALDGVASLTDKSLLRPEEPIGSEIRVGMFEAIREYGRECLDASGEAGAIQRQHARYFLEFAERAEPELLGAAQGEWLDRLEREHANLRAALDWALVSGEVEVGLRLAGALREFWEMRGYVAEGRERLRHLMPLPGAEARTMVRAKALHCAGILAWKMGDVKSAQGFLEESLAISQEGENKAGIAAAIHSLGYLAAERRDWDLAWARFEASLALRRELDDGAGIASALQNLAGTALRRGDHASWRRLFHESLAVWRELGYRWGMSFSLAGLSGVACADGDYAAAQALTEESLAIRREVGYKEGIAGSFNELGLLAYCQRDYEAARAFYEESLARYQELGFRKTCAWLLLRLDLMARHQGDYETARSLCEQSLAIAQELDHQTLIAWSLRNMGAGASLQGDQEAASGLLEEILATRREASDPKALARWLEELATLLAVQGKPSRAAKLFGAAERLREAMGAPLSPIERPDHDRHVASVGAALGEEAFAAAWAEGAAMSSDETVVYALSAEDSYGGT